MEAEHAHHVDVAAHVRRYNIVFAALTFATAATVGASYLPVSFTGHVVIALAIATFKGALVAAVFMHLMSERMALYSMLIGTMAMFAVLVALPLMTHSEMAHHPQITMHLTPPPEAGETHGAGGGHETAGSHEGAAKATDGAHTGSH